MIKPRFTVNGMLGVAIAVITLAGAAYGLHSWHTDRVNDYIDRRVDSRMEYLHIKLDVIMSLEQKKLAYQIWKQYKEERGIE
jgi:hypothetical protein